MSLINKIGNLILDKTKKNYYNSAIIVAAGSGSRMGHMPKTKQLTTLNGIPVIVRTIKQFEACPKINEIIVVAREDETDKYNLFIKQYGFVKLKAVVRGGQTRQMSVLEGLKAVSDKADFIAIHDGARCLVTPDMIEKVLSEAYMYKCASAACRCKDTIKIADSDNVIVKTPNREELWQAQTPQIFKTDLYRAAAYYALKNDYAVTDDNSLIEYINGKVKLVDCGHENIKITTPEDLYMAEAIIRMREEGLLKS